MLLAHGAPLIRTNLYNTTALMMAAKGGHDSVLRALVDAADAVTTRPGLAARLAAEKNTIDGACRCARARSPRATVTSRGASDRPRPNTRRSRDR